MKEELPEHYKVSTKAEDSKTDLNETSGKDLPEQLEGKSGVLEEKPEVGLTAPPTEGNVATAAAAALASGAVKAKVS